LRLSDDRLNRGLRRLLRSNPQRAIASRAPYAAEDQQRRDDGDREKRASIL
jgi:hypothetical protein